MFDELLTCEYRPGVIDSLLHAKAPLASEFIHRPHVQRVHPILPGEICLKVTRGAIAAQEIHEKQFKVFLC